MSAAHRIYYDPQNPRMLSPQEIANLSSTECAAACDQIDQQIVNLLQDIDGEFVKSYRTVTEKMLPSLERYGEASRGSWEGIKFWKGFFEAAANVKLSESYGASDTASAVPPSDLTESTVNDDSEASDADTTVRDASTRTGGAWAVNESPFETLQKDMRQKFGVESSVQSNAGGKVPSNTSSTSTSLRRPHLSDLSFDSPDSIQAPQLEMMSLNDRPDPASPLSEHSSAKGPIESFQLESSATGVGSGRTPKTGAGGKLLRHQVLLKQMLGTERGGPVASTPLKGGAGPKAPNELFPPEAQATWNGIADLRKTGLGDFESPRKGAPSATKARSKGKAKANTDVSADEDSLDPRSPPEMVHYSVSRTKLARTPAKEAARLVARDVLETARLKAGYANPMDLEDSPVLEPPSVVKNWATRGYDTYTAPGGLGGEGARKGFEEEAFEDDEEEEDEAVPAAGGSIRFDASVQEELSRVEQEEGDVDGAAPEGYSQLGDDDGAAHPPGGLGDDSEDSGFGGVVDDASFASRGGGADESGFPGQGEEETLFGVAQRRQSEFGADGDDFDESLAEADDQQGGNADGKARGRFSIMRPEEIETLHGGVLLESQPFEASPLQGRDWRGL